MPEKVYRYILIVGSLFAFISFFLGAVSTFYFPYITPKQIYFNVLIEILVVVWVAYILKFPDARPKKSFITIGLVAYFIVILLSCFTGVDFNLSFWGDLERMLGWFHIVHFLFYYLIIITVFRTANAWKLLFNAAILGAVYISLNGFLRGDSISNIGQNAYVAGMMIFTIYFAVLLFTRTKYLAEKVWYVIASLIMFAGFLHSDVSGAQIGLIVSILVFLMTLALVAKNKKYRLASISVLVVLGVIFGVIFSMRNDPALDGTLLGKILRDFSTTNNNLNTRILAWEGALKEFPNHSLLGTGYGNFAIVFDMNFSTEFIKYATVEENFDRAHNNIIDIMTTTGLLGLVTYLFFFGATIYYVVSGYRKGLLDKYEIAVLLALFAGYFVHNLAVFDALVSYILLMVTLGYVYFVTNIRIYDNYYVRSKSKSFLFQNIIVMIVGIVMMFITFNYNLQTILMIEKTIDGLNLWSVNKIEDAYKAYQTAHLLKNPLDRDSKNHFAELIINEGASKMGSSPLDLQEKVYKYGIQISQENVELNKYDYYANLTLARAYEVLAIFYKNNKVSLDLDRTKFLDAINKSVELIDYSILLAPNRMTPRLTRANIFLTGDDVSGALLTYRDAMLMNPNYKEIPCYLGNLQFTYVDYLKQLGPESEQLANTRYENLTKCVDNGRSSLITDSSIRDSMLAYFEINGDTERAGKLKGK